MAHFFAGGRESGTTWEVFLQQMALYYAGSRNRSSGYETFEE